MNEDNLNTVTAGFFAGTLAVDIAILRALFDSKAIARPQFLMMLDQVESAAQEAGADKYMAAYINSVRKVVRDE